MYLLYIDHSGEVADPGEEYFVMAGAAVFERQIYYVNQEFDRLQQEHLASIPERVEFHAAVMRNHNKPPWDRMPREAREQLMKDIYGSIASAHSPGLCLFGQAIEKSCIVPNFSTRIREALRKKKEAESMSRGARSADKSKGKQKLAKAKAELKLLINPIVARGFEGLCTQFEMFLRRFYEQEQPGLEQRGLIIFDHASYEKEVELLMGGFHKYGTTVTQIYNIVEAPLFSDSASTRMLQLADFVSYATFRRYASGDARYFDLIDHRFDELGGVLHGLTHVTADANCMCPACLSRRMVRRSL